MYIAAALALAIGVGLAVGLSTYLSETWFPRQQSKPLSETCWVGLLLLLLGSLILMEPSPQGRNAPWMVLAELTVWYLISFRRNWPAMLVRAAGILLAVGVYLGIPASLWTAGGHSVMALGLVIFAWGNWRAPQPRVSMVFVPLGIFFSLSTPSGYYILATGFIALAPWLRQRLRTRTEGRT